MATVEEWQMLNKSLEDAERRKAKADGALEQLLARLKSEFDLGSPEKAEERIKELEKEEQKLEKQLKPKLDSFLQKYGDRFQ